MTPETDDTPVRSRRQLLRVLGSVTAVGVAGCSVPFGRSGTTAPRATPRLPPTGQPDRTVALQAGVDPDRAVPNAESENWVYDRAFPGPEIRVPEGSVLSVDLSNRLPDPTTVHWHGIPLSNSMDGVPGVTQPPIRPGGSFTYKFRAAPAGTYFYHSHVGLQLDRGLAGPLIVEESTPHVQYDREYVLVFDDYLPTAPRLPESLSGRMGPGMGRDVRPPYQTMLLNGHRPENAPTFTMSEGDRVRLRCINASSATVFHVAIGGHRFEISHADGRPVEPTTVDSFVFASGERYDAILTADNPGRWELRATPLRGDEPAARGVFEYPSVTTEPSTPPTTAGRVLEYSDLTAVESLSGMTGSPDITFDLVLSAGPNGYTWTIDGQRYPESDPLRVTDDAHVSIRMRNRSAVHHPMHLHGHFFRVGDAIKDTVIVPGPMGQRRIDFQADNPGNWLFHCHNLYHLEAGMARVLQY